MVTAISSLVVGGDTSPATARHVPWFEPCTRFFYEEQNLRTIDVRARVDEFVGAQRIQSQMNEKGYGNTTGGFTDPTPAQKDAFTRTLLAVINGKLETAGGLDEWLREDCPDLRDTDYVVRLFKDIDNPSRRITVIHEIPVWYWNDPAPPTYQLGWGLFIIGPPVGPGPNGSSALAVEVPHACPRRQGGPGCTLNSTNNKGDHSTDIVGAEVFKQANARYLFVNGTSRVAAGVGDCDDGGCPADVAHSTHETMFQIAHRTIVNDNEIDRVFQPHGFLSEVACAEGPCQVLVSDGVNDKKASPDTQKVAAALEGNNRFEVCLYGREKTCQLNATKNLQKKYTEGRGVAFISAEVRSPINQGNEGGRDELITRLATALR